MVTAMRCLAPGQDQEGGHRHLTVLEGWRQFLTHAPSPPVLLTDQARAALGEDDRLSYDDKRLDYHIRLAIVETPVLREVLRAGRLLTLLNRHATSARRGLILSGPAGTGKTTAITQFGKRHEVIDQRQHPTALPGTRIPVVYVTVPPAATPRMLAVEFARFLGLPITSRANMTDVIEAVCGVLIDCHASLVVCDEIHNLQLATRNGGEVSDTLKYFSERIPATFVYAGIDVDREGLFTGTRGQQIAGRFSLISTVPFDYTADWRSTIATFDTALLLHRHRPGALAALDRYLHQRTGGMIGSLSHLIRGAAVQAILTGTEQITRQTLAAITLDHAAERQELKARTRRPAGPS
jgi:hypothetical protein